MVIQVAFKHERMVKRTVHIGTAHTDERLAVLVALANDTIHKSFLDFYMRMGIICLKYVCLIKIALLLGKPSGLLC